LLPGDLNGCEVGEGCDALRSSESVQDGWEQVGAASALSKTSLSAEALLGCVDRPATGGLGNIGLTSAFLLAFDDDALDPTEGLEPRRPTSPLT